MQRVGLRPAPAAALTELMVEASVPARNAQVVEGRAAGTPSLGPLPCISCGAKVLWVRASGGWVLRDEDGEKHKCRGKE